MRIAEACYLFSPAVGGVEAHVLNIGTNLVRWGHSVDVYTSDFMALNGLERVIRSSEDRSRGHSVVAGMRVFRLPSHAVRKTTAYAQRLRFPGLLKWLLASDYDVVHVHSIASLHFDLAFVAAKLRGTPVVVTGHYSPSDLDRLWSKRRRLGPLSYPTARLVYWRTWMRFALRHVDAVVAIAGSERERMIALLGLDPARVFTIPNGVNPAEFEAVDESSAVAFRSARGYADDPVVLFVGRISRVKGPDILLEAAARLLGQSSCQLPVFVLAH